MPQREPQVIAELRRLIPDTPFSIETTRREGVDSFGEYNIYEQESTIWIGSMPKAIGQTPEKAFECLRKSVK